MRRHDVPIARDLVPTGGNDHRHVRDEFHHGLPFRSSRAVRVCLDRRRERPRRCFLCLATQAVRDLHEEEQEYEQLPAEKVSDFRLECFLYTYVLYMLN